MSGRESNSSSSIFNKNSTIRSTVESFARKSTTNSVDDTFGSEGKSSHSLFCLSTNNPIRKCSSRLVNSKPFDYFMLLTIAANCVVLLLDAPQPAGDYTDLNKQLKASEVYFVAIYSVEALVKILAFGFILHPGAYLRNGWNILDFIVLIIGIIGLIPELSQETRDNSEGIKALRAIRVLRPLKLVSGIPSLQVVMKSIIRAMKPLMQILFLILFIIVVYAIIGLELLVDRFHYTCVNVGTGEINSTVFPHRPCGPDGGRSCGTGQECRHIDSATVWPGPHYGITSYDNIFLSMLTVFQCVTMEGWTEIMYISMDAREYKYGVVTSILYTSLIIIGSFFMLNLVLGVLSGEFAKERERVEKRQSYFKIRRQQELDRMMSAYSDWITKAEEIILREEENEDQRQAEAARRIQEQMTHKRHSLSDSIMNLIDGNKELLNHLNNCRKEATNNVVTKTETIRKIKQKVKKGRFYVRQIVRSQFFYWAVIVCVFLNTLVIALEHYGQPVFLTNFQEMCEIVFLAIFIAEMLFKMYGLGIRTYFESAFNIFDFTVVLCGIIEMIIQEAEGISLGISVLRSLRLLRIFKVTRFWKSLRNLVTSLLNSVRSILSLIFLLLLFIFIFALLGMQLFGAKFNNKLDPPRTNFDNFFKAMLAVFQMLSGEDWATVMYEGILACGGPNTFIGMVSSLYFVGLIVLGNYTLLNVFLAIAVDNLATAQALTRDDEREQRERELARKRRQDKRRDGWMKAKKQLPIVIKFKNLPRKNRRLGLSETRLTLGTPNTPPEDSNRSSIEVQPENDMTSPEDVSFRLPTDASRERGRSLLYELPEDHKKHAGEDVVVVNGNQDDPALGATPKMKFEEVIAQVRNIGIEQDEEGSVEDEDPEYIAKSIRHHGFARSLRNPEKIIGRRLVTRKAQIIRKNSLFIFTPENAFRKFCHWIVNLRYFDDVILVLIATSSLSLAIEDPVVSSYESERNKVLYYFDLVFTAIFAFEVVVKVVDTGAILHRGSYFRDPWNVIDTVVVGANITTLVISNSSNISLYGGDIVKCLRVLRVLRPLKAINKSRKLKIVFQCMVYSLKNVINIILITLLFLLIFAVIGVQLFQGKMFYCTDPSKRTQGECKGYYYNYHRANSHRDFQSYKVDKREWKEHVFNFDSLPAAMLTLFSSCTGEGWPTVMYQTVDATEVDMGPVRDFKIHMSIFYVCFVVVFSFFFINIFVALIIVTFQESGERNIVGCELDRNQRDCIQFAINAKPRQRFMPEDKETISYKVWLLVESKPFEIVVMFLIALNAVVLMMSYHNQSKLYEQILNHFNTGFTLLFTIEAIFKLVAFRTNYFRDGWNVFDFIIVLITFSGVILNLVRGTNDIPIDPTFFRLFRAARLIKLLRQGYTIRMLLWTFLQSIKALPYVVTLMAMLFFIYAVVGMQLFGKIQLDDSSNIKHHNNFHSFPRALQVLFRSATGESWHMVMKDCYTDALCDSRAGQGPGATCGNTVAAIVYFCSFYFLCSFLMLNLFVAVILDNFEYLTRDESILGPHHLDEFVRVWSEYDPTATGRIAHEDVYQLMCDMSPPVGFGRKCPRFLAYKRLIKMNMPIMGDNNVLFTSTLFALIRTALSIHNSGERSQGDEKLRQVIKMVWPRISQKILNRMMPRESVLSSHQLTVGKVYCAKLIYENYKTRKRRQELNEPRKKRQQSLFRRFMTALRTNSSSVEDEEAGNEEGLPPPSPGYPTERRRSHTLNTPPLAFRDKPSDSVKMSKNKSVRFFRKSHKKRNAVNRRTVSGRIVTFSEEIPMDLTDINPTIVDSDERCRSATGRPRAFTFDNPAVSLEDEKFIPNALKKSPSFPYSRGSWPLTPALVIVQVPSIQPQPPPNNNDTLSPGALDPSFPDVIRSAETSPRTSVSSMLQHASVVQSTQLIREINEKIAEAVQRGQSPYSIYAIQDGDEASWC